MWKNLYLVENIFRKSQCILLYFYYSFLTWQVIGNAVIKHQRRYRSTLGLQIPYFDLKCLAQCLFSRYFNVDFDAMDHYFLVYIYISENYVHFRKKQRHLSGKIFGSPIQVIGSTYCRIFFQTMNTPKIYVHNLEMNWKISVFIRVKNFANLQISRLHCHLYQIKNLPKVGIQFSVRKLI